MTKQGRLCVVGLMVVASIVLSTGWTVGCHHANNGIDYFSVPNTQYGDMTIAVAPAINLSGSSDFDTNRFADMMASELSYAEGISVVPVSRVLGVLRSQGVSQVSSPEHALELVGLLGVDAILVIAVTEYDPYDPPSIGISAQLYGKRARPGIGAFNPVSLSRKASLASSSEPKHPRGVLAQTQRVFDASHRAIGADIRRFASWRGSEGSPFGWRRYVVSQRHYIRYCCYATIRDLLGGLQDRQDAVPTAKK